MKVVYESKKATVADVKSKGGKIVLYKDGISNLFHPIDVKSAIANGWKYEAPLPEPAQGSNAQAEVKEEDVPALPAKPEKEPVAVKPFKKKNK